MANKSPSVDKRTAADIIQQVEKRLESYAPNWDEIDPTTGKPTGISAALIGVFARYAELIIQRLNQVPNKNFLAFLNLLGASQVPPQPAKTPLLFSLAAGSQVDAIVPAGTQVAAAPTGGNQPIIFETQRDLVVTSAQLHSVFVRDPQTDSYSDYSDITTDAASPIVLFQAKNAIAHLLYIGSNTLLNYSDIQTLTLNFTLQNPVPLEWEIYTGGEPILISASSTQMQSGVITFTFTNLPQVPQTTINSITSRWLRCRPINPITSQSQLPIVSNITLQATLGNTGQPELLKTAFTNLAPQDLSKPFFPFGEKPQFGDTFYLADRQAFAKGGANVTLHIDLANLVNLGFPTPATSPNLDKLKLEWEVWTTQGWMSVGTSTPQGSTTASFQDETKAFTAASDPNTSNLLVTFTLPENVQATTLNGVNSFWLRVRIASGNYGEEASYQRDNSGAYTVVPASFTPPLINSIAVEYSVNTLLSSPDAIATYNNFSYQLIPPIAINYHQDNLTSPPTPLLQGEGSNTPPFPTREGRVGGLGLSQFEPFTPFTPIADAQPTLYLGFSLPPNRSTFPNRPLSLYFQLAQVLYQPHSNTSSSSFSSRSPTRLVWEYCSSTNQQWEKLIVQDDTATLTRSGVVEFLPPADFVATQDFNQATPLYWLRVYCDRESSQFAWAPQLNRILLNTTIAIQAATIRNEILSSSDGTQNQTFQTMRSPLLVGEYLEVREPEIPSAEEQAALQKIYGKDAITVIQDTTGRPLEIWVRWQPMPDFYGSGPRDRHYVIDRITGTINFGDGVNGMIPPIGTNNVRMRRYQTGGGTAGNQSANAIVQLRTTIPYVATVTNPEPATGGADAQSLDSVIRQAPRTVRHGGRAVTFEDYEDLAMQATPAVARAKCVPLLNLYADPEAIQNAPVQLNRNDAIAFSAKAPGQVSIIIVPRSSDPQPIPSMALIAQVQDYLETYAIATATIWVVGPLYVEVSVTADIVPTSLDIANTAEQAVQQALTNFLHPLTGGFDSKGWAFGRLPYKSDFYRLLESIPGVDRVRSLQISPDITNPASIQSDVQAKLNTQRFLVFCGDRTITLSFDSDNAPARQGLKDAVGEFGKPNPPAPFPRREGGARLPSPLRGGAGGGVTPFAN